MSCQYKLIPDGSNRIFPESFKYGIAFFCLLISLTIMGQSGPSTTENYIYTKNCLDLSCLKRSEVISYYDGLGRIRQVIGIKETPAGNDLVLPTVYDDAGKKTRDYLGLPQTGSTGGALYQQSNSLTAFPVNDASGVYSGEKIFSEKTFDNSPLNRLKQETGKGNDWNNKPVKFDYNAVTVADGVRKFVTTTSWVNGATQSILAEDWLYRDGQLYKNTTTDEDGNKTIVFKNSKGQTVVVRKVINGSENADTHYVYNKYDQLAFVLPPLASIRGDIVANTLKHDELCYQYRYDGRNRLVEQKMPGKGWEYMLYDKQDRLVATQDANLRAKGQWLYTKYDKFGRVVITGINTGSSRTTEQALADLQGSNNVSRIPTVFFNRQGMDVYYDNPEGSYPNSPAWVTLLSVNYYDTYPQGTPSAQVQVFGQNVLQQPGSGNTTSQSTQGLALASYIKNIDDDKWTKNYTYYDTKGRAISAISVNHLGGYTQTDTELDFTGMPLKTYTIHKRKADETGVTINERFVYDNKNRLKQYYHKVDDKPEELLSENTYNERSQLVNKKVGNNLQSIDYAYNIRGWLTGINKGQMELADVGGKLFSYKIKYAQRDGITNPDPVLFAGKDVAARYNGNIAEIDWRSVETPGVNPPLTPKRYGYAYDSFNRLTAGFYQNPNNPYSKENTESINYDLGGNITDLYRTSVMENGSTTATKIDDLVYTYRGNQAITIKDNSLNSTGYEGVEGFPMEYDDNGNLKNLKDKGINSISYNYLNLPSVINIGFDPITTQIKTNYRADGVKLRKTNIKTSSGFGGTDISTQVSDYLDGFQYFKTISSGTGGVVSEFADGVSMFKRAFEPQAFTPVDPTIDIPIDGGTVIEEKNPDLQFFPTSEGFYDYQKNQYIYQYKDLFGNVRVSFAKNSAGALEIVDSNDYYPYGMNHLKTGNAFFAAGSYKSYKFLGNELQETGFYDMNARFYMPDLGRFMTHDPLSSSTLEPYGYAYGNPLFFTDVTGLRSDPINGGNGPGGPGDQIKANELGGSANPYQIPEIVLNAPIRAIASNPGSVMPSYCSVCYSGNGTSSGINLSAPQIQNVQPTFTYRGPENGQGGGVVMMDSMVWDLVGIVIANNISAENQQAALGLGALAIILSKGKAADEIVKAESNIWKVGAYNELKGVEAGLDAHHVGQSAIMKRLVEGYDHKTAPTILVPKLGHTIGTGVVSRSTKGFESARQVVARDIFELRRVYGSQGIPNSSLQELIQANKIKYPNAFIKPEK